MAQLHAAIRAFEAEYLPSGLRDTPEWRAVVGAGESATMTAADVSDEMLNAGQERLCELRCATSFDDALQAEVFAAMFNARESA